MGATWFGLLIGSPARQGKEAMRRVREILIKLGGALKSDNIFELELTNRSRCWRCRDDLIRGLTVDGWIPTDEAARLSPDLITAP